MMDTFIMGTGCPYVEPPPFDERKELEELRRDKEDFDRAYEEQVKKVKRGERHDDYWNE